MLEQSRLLRWVLLLVGFYLAYDLLLLFDTILIPMAYAGVLACLLLPVVRQLESRGWPSGLATFVVVLLVLLAAVGIVLLMIDQAQMFAQDYPVLRVRAEQAYDQMLRYLSRNWGLNIAESNAYLNQKLEAYLEQLFALAGSTLRYTGSLLLLAVMVPLFTFFLLVYRQLFVQACVFSMGRKHRDNILLVVERIREVMGRYILGILTVMVGVSISFGVILFLLGVPHAPFFAITSAALNIVPYIGIYIGATLTAIYGGLITGQTLLIPLIFGLMWAVHALEANVVTPSFVGRRVRMNALAAIIAVLLGGEIWGFSGMLLALPYTAALKIVAEYVPGMAALATLIGEKKPKPRKMQPRVASLAPNAADTPATDASESDRRRTEGPRMPPDGPYGG